MNPETGEMHRLLSEDLSKLRESADAARNAKLDDAERRMKEGHKVDADTLQTLPPNLVEFREGEVIEIRGCWFRVDALRRTRMTLTPIPRPRHG